MRTVASDHWVDGRNSRRRRHPRYMWPCFKLWTCISSLLFMATSMLEACQPGFYGEKCEFECQCKNLTDCSSLSGACGPSGCKAGYFGPGCQYMNLLHLYTGSIPSPVLIDGSETTCYQTNPIGTLVVVSLSQAFMFFWMRITLGSKVSIESSKFGQNLEVVFDNKQHCRVLLYSDNGRDFDVYCSKAGIFTNITLAGKGLYGNFCEVSISGGWNSALKQKVVLVSGINATSETSAAVDGSVYSQVGTPRNCGVCSTSVNIADNDGFLLITFLHAQIIMVVRIFSAISLNGTQLISLSKDDNVVESLLTSLSPGPCYSQTVFLARQFSEKLKVVNLRNWSIPVCEVQVFTENECPDGFYDFQCSKPCNCSKTYEICHFATGSCGDGCHGEHKFKCQQTCTRNCEVSNCIPRVSNPNCGYCQSGYMLPDCVAKCPAGLYGANCSNDCSNICVDLKCDHITGQCDNCIEGYTGKPCTACPQTFYGLNCMQKCGDNCRNKVCDHENGICVACANGFFGTDCKECPPKMFGKNCSEKCPEYCLNSLCNKVSGLCLHCTPGFFGGRCNRACPLNTFGPECRGNCSERCEPMTCDKIDGKCTCEIGFYDVDCRPCEGRYHGKNCTSNCPSLCKNKLCDNITGKCLSCVQGRSGPHCSEENEMLWITVAAAVTVSLLPLCILIRLSKKILSYCQKKIENKSSFESETHTDIDSEDPYSFSDVSSDSSV